MATLPRLSEESEESFESFPSKGSNGDTRNFSRPRPSYHSQNSNRSYQSASSKRPAAPARPASSDRGGRGNVHTISAFHGSNRDFRDFSNFPDEPRFSLDSDTTDDPSETSRGSENAWDGRRGELHRQHTPTRKFDQQRFEPEGRPRPSASRYSSQTSMEPYHLPQTRTTVSAGPTTSGILKRVSVDQQSERLSVAGTDGQEDTASHHTVSEDGDSGSFDVDGNWQSSNYDTTGLSDSQIRKLLKKGINPSLYAEMKAAKKGKNKWVGPLLGNSFLG